MKFTVKYLSIVLFLSISVLCISFGGQKAEWKGKIEIENGVKIIQNPGYPLYGEIKLELEEDLSIGNENDENYLFYRARDIQVDLEGNIYVLDSGNHRLQVFDKNGKSWPRQRTGRFDVHRRHKLSFGCACGKRHSIRRQGNHLGPPPVDKKIS